MKNNLLITGFFLMFSFMFSQDYLKEDNVKVIKFDENDKVKFASFKTKANIPERDSNALLKETLGLNDLHELKLDKSEDDIFGAKHLHYKQYYNEIEVAYSKYSVHIKNGVITSINGSFSPIVLSSDTSVLLSPEQIYLIGLSHLGNDYEVPQEFQNSTPINRLVILPKIISKANEDRYAYQFSLVSMQKGTFEKVFLDALTGEVLKKESLLKTHTQKQTVFTEEQVNYLNQIEERNQSYNSFSNLFMDTGNADTRYSGLRDIETTDTDTGYVLRDETRFLTTKNMQGLDYLFYALTVSFGTPGDGEALAVDYLDADNNWTSEEYAATKDDGALEAHWAFSSAYDFFKSEYERDGFDGTNGSVTSFIHTIFWGNPSNAAWLTLATINPEWKGGCMFVGDGDYDPIAGTGNWDILAPVDVISHEFAHGVDTAGGNLVYERESGAMDEGFADIWGATIEAKQAPEKQRWIIGEDFVMVNPDGIRSLKEPKIFNQPNTYLGKFWVDATVEGCPTPGQDNDNCGVHTNSGVLNYWYYLLTEGGTGINDNNYEYEVSGIGIKKAADLIYSTQVSYVQSQSQFADVKDYTIEEAGLLYGEESAEVTSVKAAWCAVGVAIGEECNNLGILDMTKNILNVFPNPTSGILNVNTSMINQKIVYEINNFSGQIVLKGNLISNKINVSTLPIGAYVLTLIGEDKKQSSKFLKK